MPALLEAPHTAPKRGPAARPNSMRMTYNALVKGLEHDRGWIAELEGKDIARFQLGLRPIVSLGHPDYIDHVLFGNQSNYGRTVEYDILRTATGVSLLTDEGDSWRKHRAMLTPMFAKRRIDKLIDLMTEPLEEIAERLHTQHDEQIQVSELMVGATLEVLGRAMFGRTFADDVQTTAERVVHGMQMAERVERLTLMYAPSEPVLRRLEAWVRHGKVMPPQARVFQNLLTELDDWVWGIVNERRANPTDTTDLLNLLLGIRDENDQPLPLQRVRDETFTLLMAGHETTANGLAWMWWLLTQNPEAYDRLLAEVDEVLDGRTPTIADLPNLKWTQACFEEALRYYPPVWIMPRKALQDDVIDGHHIDAGSTILIPIRHMHHDSRWWDEPERYDPARFLPGAADDRPRCAYLPFGGGKRVCIGRSFALMEAVLVTAMLAQHVRFEALPGHTVRPEATFTMRPQGGLPMVVKSRRAA